MERTKRKYYFRLESESSRTSEEDTESVYSYQDKETDCAKDTTDTEENCGSDRDEYEVEIEYEVDSLSEGDNSIGSTDSEVTQDIVLAAAAAIYDTSFEAWVTDGEDSDNSSTDDSFYGRTDFDTCVQCKSENNNPLYRYCLKCFQDRKTSYPPRPKRHRKSKAAEKKSAPVKLDHLKSCLSGLSSQDSGIGSSQECPPLDLDQIVVPKHLTTPTSTSKEEDPTAGTSNIKTTPQTVFSLQESRKRQISESSLSEFESVQPKRLKTSNQAKIESMQPEKEGKRNESSEICSQSSSVADNVTSVSENASLPEVKEMCIFCNLVPKNSIFLHGNIGHMCCCYQCAVRTWKTIKRCPICNRKVNNVVKVFTT